jgi:hypothetical protein
VASINRATIHMGRHTELVRGGEFNRYLANTIVLIIPLCIVYSIGWVVIQELPFHRQCCIPKPLSKVQVRINHTLNFA